MQYKIFMIKKCDKNFCIKMSKIVRKKKTKMSTENKKSNCDKTKNLNSDKVQQLLFLQDT